MDDAADHYRARLSAEADRVRASNGLGRSGQLIRLFDYLLACSLADRLPREIEIAQDVFNRGADSSVLQDASVRVYVFRLRKKLEEFYADAPAHQERLGVPRGEYRLTLTSVAEPAEASTAPIGAAPARTVSRFWIGLALILVVNLLGWATFVALRTPSRPAAVSTAFWKPLTANGFPPFIAVGDYYIFGEAPDGVQVTRLIREYAINSRDDLDSFLMEHPTEVGRYVDMDLHYLPVSIGTGLRNILPVMAATDGRFRLNTPVVTMSQLTLNVLKNANVVYVGFLSGLGLLRDPLFQASGFKIGESYDELIDKASGKVFRSDWDVVAQGKTPRRDYGYIASMPGPVGNRILIIAGTRDAAVIQASEIAADTNELTKIAGKAGSPSFEALYEVRTLGNVNLGSRLVVARAIGVANIWQPDRPTNQQFPDQRSSAGDRRP